MTTKHLLSLFLALLLAVPGLAKPKSAPAAVRLTVENMAAPEGLTTLTPRFSWQISDAQPDSRQTHYRILVASRPELLTPGSADLWDSGLTQSDAQLWLPYAGKPLRDGQRAYWTVQTTTNHGTSGWANAQPFSIGLTAESHWQGRWIGIDSCLTGERRGYRSRLAARYIRHEIALKAQPITRATAYIAAVGLYELYVNGSRVDERHVMKPQPTDTRKSVIYNTIDITDAIQGVAPCGLDTRVGTQHGASALNENTPTEPRACLGIVLGNGRAFPMRQSKPSKVPFMGFPKCRVNVVIEYADGSRQTVASDDKWKITAAGPIRANNEYDGEEYDARQELGSWSVVGYDDRAWPTAMRSDIPEGELIGQPAPNMAVLKTIEPVTLTKLAAKQHIVDFGQNMAGWVQLRMSGAKGDTVRIKFAEKLNADGTLYLANFRDALSEDIYVCNGKEAKDGTLWHPTFVTHGFRYVMISGPATLAKTDVEAQVVSDEMGVSGTFACSDATLNTVYRNASWGILSNYKGMPVDCPQRNERQPWLGDRTVGSLGESYMFGCERLYSKWMRDICESQRADGVISDVAPAFWRYYNDDVTWPSVLPFTCDMLIRQYGNDAPMRRAYPYIKRWLGHLFTDYYDGGIITRDQYGDWCVPPEGFKLIHSKDPARQTDGRLLSTAYTIQNLRLMQQFAKMQGFIDDEQRFAAREKEMTEAFNREFLHIKRGTSLQPGHTLYPDSVFYGNNSATSNLLPLALGLVPKDCERDVADNLVANIVTKNNDHVSCGVIGISWLMRTLSKIGRADLAFRLASQTTYPSWGYMAANGATTIWELWNGNTADPRMNSGNHVMLLGDLMAWYYECLAGIKCAPDAVAFKRLRMAPDFGIEELDSVRATLETPYGLVASSWAKTLERLTWTVTLPPNTTAELVLPDGTVRNVASGTTTVTCQIRQKSSLVLDNEFVYDHSQYSETHASSIVELKNGDLVATYFGGTKERNPDVCIWTHIKKKGSDTWSAATLAADGVLSDGSAEQQACGVKDKWTKATVGPIKALGLSWADAKAGRGEKMGKAQGLVRKACWNPVLFQMPSGELWLFFKIGSDVGDWTGWVTKSRDGGRTWSDKTPLPEGFLGPVKNKPEIVGNRLICPTSTEGNGWKFHFEILDLATNKWKYVGPIERELAPSCEDMLTVVPAVGTLPKAVLKEGKKAKPIDCIQPSILRLKDGRLQCVGRTRNGRLASTVSADNGDTWTPVTLLDVPNNQSGTDAVTLKDGRHVLIYNNVFTVPGTKKGARTPCSLAISDDGQTWRHFLTLEDSPIGQYSYPSIIQGRDGTLHCIYTWRRQRIVYQHIALP